MLNIEKKTLLLTLITAAPILGACSDSVITVGSDSENIGLSAPTPTPTSTPTLTPTPTPTPPPTPTPTPTPTPEPTPPSPTPDELVKWCKDHGAELGTADMKINAGQKTVDVKQRSNTVDLAGGHISEPYVLDQQDTIYRLTGDLIADVSAFDVQASHITIDLNGHTVTYLATDAPGGTNAHAVFSTIWNRSDIVIVNGTIKQGDGECKGNENGIGCSPITFKKMLNPVEVGGLRIEYHTPDTGGIYAQWKNAWIHHNTFVDSGTVVTNRHQGIPAINVAGSGGDRALIEHNLIQNARHRGIDLGDDDEAAYNEIYIDSRAANSYGVFSYKKKNIKIHHNKIYGIGVNSIGIGVVQESSKAEVYTNYTENETTRWGGEYGNTSADGFRTTWGIYDSEVYCNTFRVIGGRHHPDLHGTGDQHTPDGLNFGRAIWVGTSADEHVIDIHHNVIESISYDPRAYVPAVALVASSPEGGKGVKVHDNYIQTNRIAISLFDSYEGTGNNFPRITNNRVVKKSIDNVDEHYVSIYAGTIYDSNCTALLLENDFEDEAEITDDNVEIDFCAAQRNNTLVDVRIGGFKADGTDDLEYGYTNDPDIIDSAKSFEPFGGCGGYKVYFK